MPRVFKPRDEATSYTPVKDETFGDIVKTKCEVVDPPITLDEVALFNWGTKVPREVVRALVELVGCNEVDEADPAKCKMDLTRGPGAGKILLPKLWTKDGLAYETVHTLKVKKALPATAISITSLDKWFLPADESCDVGYALEGLHSRALKVDMDVYASNYATLVATNSGEFVSYAYTDSLETPIIEKVVVADAPEGSAGSESSWKGESKASVGLLKPRGAAARYINAASSPYTVSLRYYKKPEHKKSTLRLASFWPRWTGAVGLRAVVDDSLKFKWILKDCPASMQGQFQIFDKEGKIIWRQALTPLECGNGEHEHNWTEGKLLIEEAKMPYRVQVQVHTNKDTDPGLGLAAMHTEVRLLTHPEIGTHGVDHEKEPQVLSFALAPFYSGTAPVEDSAKGRKLRLAKAGYHPGAIEDGEAQAPYLQAVKEFQRDHAKAGTFKLIGASIPPERLKADGVLTDITKTLMAAQAEGRRPLFGTDARVDIIVEATLNTAINTKATQIISWVDDRNNYTRTDPTLSAYLLPNMGLENYRGSGNGAGDGKQTYDKASICRPWLPFEVAMPLMKKADSLQTASPAIPVISDSMRNALGPIRVDWTFRDLAPEYKVNTAEYTATRVRSLRYLTTAIDAIKGTHDGKDAFNCTTALGGVRGVDYYKEPYGVDDESLMPWKALPDAGVSTVCTVAHDDLGQDEARFYAGRRGKAGAYFHPSIVGGDGYQCRAQVSFRDMPSGETHPNWKVLRDRYEATSLPQAHTAPIRLWRKDSYRAHVKWTSTAGHWGAHDVENKKFYEAGMVHLVYESDTKNTFLASAMYPGLFGPGVYRTLVSSRILGGTGADPKTNRYRAADEITLSDRTIWPWSEAKHLGVQGVPAPATTLPNYWRVHGNQVLNDTWRNFREALVYDLLSKLESNEGLLRGHLIGEFKASPQYWREMYRCSVCPTDQILIESAATGGSGVGEHCRAGVCAGVLHSKTVEDYTCNKCTVHAVAKSISLKLGGTACTTPCTGTKVKGAEAAAGFFTRTFGNAASVTTTYACNVCADQTRVVETGAGVGAQAGVACGKVCPRGGKMIADPGSKTPQQIAGPTAKLGLPSWGGPLGGLFLDTDEGPRTYWSHEVGHHKDLEHAGDVIAVGAQHDRAANTVDLVVAGDADVNSQKWDRDCIMSYVNTETGLDQAYFCGKCLLKLRGWKVEGLVDPAGNLAGP